MKAWRAIVAWTEVREPVTWLAGFRMVVAAIVAWTICDLWLSGALTLLWLPPEHGGLEPLAADARVRMLGGPSSVLTFGLCATVLAGCGLVFAGLGTRVAALVTGQALLALLSLAPGTGGGHDRLLTNALWLLVLAPSDASLSVGCRLRTGAWQDDTPRAAWPRRLIAWQLVVMYTITGWQKLGDEWWPWGGLTAVYRSLLQPSYARFDLTSLAAQWFPLTQVMTMVTVLWEGGFFLLIVWWWAQDRGLRFGRWPVRGILLGTGVIMHGMLWFSANLGPFPFITLAYYLGCFDHTDWVAARRKLGTSLRAAAPSTSAP